MGRLLSPWGVRPLLKPWVSPGSALWPTKKGSVLNVYTCIHHKTVQRSLWGGALQRMYSDAAIESFWRWKVVEILSFLWSMGGPPGSPGVPGASPEVPGACPGGPQGVPGACPGVPGAFLGVPGTSPGVPGACPGDPGDPMRLRGRPGHPRDPFHKDDSVI